MEVQQCNIISYTTPLFPDCNLFLVISHSCDIARDKCSEPYIEVLPCHKINKIDGINTLGKTARRLHFFINRNELKEYYCINAFEKLFIKKEDIEPNYKIVDIEDTDLSIYVLQNWLSFRYRREALPDEINQKLKKIKFKKKLNSVKNEIHSIHFKLMRSKILFQFYSL
ncbi:MAG: hypothetical protein EOL97_11010 [Spirochaetia bacterium]|nr:hypothetical protein [Spirochaetia bacterium]